MQVRIPKNRFGWPLVFILLATTAVEGASPSLIRAGGASQRRGIDMFVVIPNHRHQCHDLISLGGPELMADIRLSRERGITEISVTMLLTQQTLRYRRSNDQIEWYWDGRLVRRVRDGLTDLVDERFTPGPAVKVLTSVLEDGELRYTFLVEDLGRAMDCSSCRPGYSIPDDCDDLLELACCIRWVENWYCLRVCDCLESDVDSDEYAQDCRNKADALYRLELRACFQKFYQKLLPWWPLW